MNGKLLLLSVKKCDLYNYNHKINHLVTRVTTVTTRLYVYGEGVENKKI